MSFLKHTGTNEKVHFASLTDICHLKNVEFGTETSEILRQNCSPWWHCWRWLRRWCCNHRARIVLRHKMTAAKIMDVIAKLPDCEGQAADEVSAYAQVKNGRCSQMIENSQFGMSRHLDSSTTTQLANIMVQYGRPSRSSWAKSEWSIFSQDCCGKGTLRKS